jgi:beta-galactosidase
MKKTLTGALVALTITMSVCGAALSPTSSSPSIFAISDQDFLLAGQLFVIRSGEMHYSRIPREYWPQRLRMARALGLWN